MAIWSRLLGALSGSKLPISLNKVNSRSFSLSKILQSGDHGHHEMRITPSRWQWDKFKDMLHYYVMVGIIPCTLIVLYCNVFIGPAQLSPIPEGYTPKAWEYASHPITRFIARYIYHSPQQDYEKYCHHVHEEKDKMILRELEQKIKDKMAENVDYQAYYYRPVTAKYLRAYKDTADELYARLGDEEK